MCPEGDPGRDMYDKMGVMVAMIATSATRFKKRALTDRYRGVLRPEEGEKKKEGRKKTREAEKIS